jgi:nicotinamide-nucleotide amidase
MTAEVPGRAESAAIIAIGSEMLGPLRQDTNSLWLTARLEEIGIPVSRKSIVGDDPAVIRDELDAAARGARFVFTRGPPDPRERHRRAVWRLARRAARAQPQVPGGDAARFRAAGLPRGGCSAERADFIVGARCPNPHGTAPGAGDGGTGSGS